MSLDVLTSQLKLLLVEDSPTYAALVEAMLEGEDDGAAVRHVETLVEAEAALTGTPADCVILDLSLPDTDGLETLRRLHAGFPDTPVVVLTGQDDQELGLQAVHHGAQDYLCKRDCDGHTLTRAIRYAVERGIADRALAHQALHDQLTALPNRALLADRVEMALSRMERSGEPLALLFIDLDNFKLVNDTLGHRVGDEVIAEVARRLVITVRPTDTVARFGGDELVVLCDGIGDIGDVMGIVERVQLALAQPVLAGGATVYVTASIGVALAEGDRTSVDELVRDADAAMYAAKARGKNAYEIFNRRMRASLLRRREIEEGVREGLRQGSFQLVYQPIVDLASEKVTAIEALCRWPDAAVDAVEPTEFIRVAEDTGLIGELGLWVLDRACADAADLRARLAEVPPIAVNVSGLQLRKPGLADEIAHVLEDRQLPPGALQLELTETSSLGPEALAEVHRVRELGVHLAVDDFGTGYAAMEQLERLLPVDTIKIDGSFIASLPAASAEAIVAALSVLASRLRVNCVAEAVESEDQAQLLRDLGCDAGQGFHFLPPVPLETLAGYLSGAPAGAC